MMHLCATILLVALAAGYVSAQSNIQYDINNCMDYKNPPGVHHVPDEDNCLYFMNCDGDKGTRTPCPAGTVYDRPKYVCTENGSCPRWENACMGSTGIMNFADRCCRNYFSYNCGTGTFIYAYCPTNQTFSPYTGVCDNSNSGNCSLCDQSGTNNTDKCKDTHMTIIDRCRFRKGNDPAIMWCSQGEVTSETECRCVGANDNNACSQQNTGPCNSSTEGRIVYPSGKYNYKGTDYWVYNNGSVITSNSYQFTPSAYIEIDYFKGNYLGGDFTLRLRLSSGSVGVVLFIGAPGDSKCNDGSRLAVTLTSEGLSVIVRNSAGESVLFSASFNGGTIEFSVKVTANSQGIASRQGTLRVNGRIVDGPKSVPALGQINYYCGLQIGRCQGSLEEFTFNKCAA